MIDQSRAKTSGIDHATPARFEGWARRRSCLEDQMTGELGDRAGGERYAASTADGAAIVRRLLNDAAAVLERLLGQSLDAARARLDSYSADPARSFEEAQRYIVHRVKERPVTAALSGLGVGLFLGLLLARSRR
jgi:hypothetical protein